MGVLQNLKKRIGRSFKTIKSSVVEEVPEEVVGCVFCNETSCTHDDIEQCPNRQYHEKMYASQNSTASGDAKDATPSKE